MKKDKTEALYQRIQALDREVAAVAGHPDTQRLQVLEAQRATTLEELRVVLEELQDRNAELAATREAVEAERRRYQELFDGAPDGYLVTDGHGVIREANYAAARLLNIPKPALAGKPLLLYLAEEERQSFHARLRDLLAAGPAEEWEVWLHPRDREPVAVGLTLSALTIGGGSESIRIKGIANSLKL